MNKLKYFLVISLTIVINITVTVTIIIIENKGGWSPYLNLEIFNKYTDLVMFVMTFISILILILTIIIQSISNTKLKYESLLMKHIESYDIMINKLGNKNIFQKIVTNVIEAKKKLNELDESVKITDLNLKNIYRNEEILENDRTMFDNKNIDLKDQIQNNVSYLITFAGVTEDNIESLKHLLGKKYSDRFIEEVLKLFITVSMISAEIPEVEENSIVKNKKEFFNSNAVFDGFHNELGSYFRNIYQIYTFIDKKNLLNQNEKYQYLKLLRAKFSHYEQIVFFLNSISELGLDWEYKSCFNRKKKRKLVSKYNIIKNITPEYIKLFSIDKYYQNVEYEFK